jgi:hypothetical protein
MRDRFSQPAFSLTAPRAAGRYAYAYPAWRFS